MSPRSQTSHFVLAFLTVLLAPLLLQAQEVDRRKLYVDHLKGCAGVITSGGPATGWVVDVEKRWVMTCQHVVGSLEEVEIVFPAHKDGKVVQERDWYLKSAPRLKGKVISADPKRDLAIIEVESFPDGTRALTLAADSAQPGDNLYLIGNPAASGAMWNYSIGTLRAVYKKRFTYKQSTQEVDAVVGETQLPGNPGDSGGAVFGDKGEVLGVHCGGTPEGAQLLSTYIDVREIRDFLKEPLKGVAKAKNFDDFIRRGTEHFNKGDWDRALADYDEAIKLNPKYADGYRCRAGVLIRKKQYETAFKDCEEALRLDPKNAAAHNERAVCYGAKGDFKAALEDYSEAIRLNPREAMFWAGRAWTYNSLKQPEKAVSDAGEALKLNGEFPFALNERGLAYYNLQKYDKAAADFDHTLKLDPQNTQARYNRGVTASARAKYQDAITDFNELLRRSPDHALALKERGIAYHKDSAHEKALRDLDRYLALQPNDAGALLWRSQCHKALGNDKMAEADSRRAAELNPMNRPGS
jgi:tetratricopeptide (TPR) repeat protein